MTINQIIEKRLSDQKYFIFRKKDIKEYLKKSEDFSFFTKIYYNSKDFLLTPIKAGHITVYFEFENIEFEPNPVKIVHLSNKFGSRPTIGFDFINKNKKEVSTVINFKNSLKTILVIINEDEFLKNLNYFKDSNISKKIKLDILLGKFLVK